MKSSLETSISGFDTRETARTEKLGDRVRFAQAAPAILAEWEVRKKQGELSGQVGMV